MNNSTIEDYFRQMIKTIEKYILIMIINNNFNYFF